MLKVEAKGATVFHFGPYVLSLSMSFESRRLTVDWARAELI